MAYQQYCLACCGMAVFAVLFAAKAKEPQRRDPVVQWYCKVLHKNFDPKAAIAAFPLEKLPAPTEKMSKPSKDRTVIYTLTAKGDFYTVTYQYTYSLANVDDLYGLELKVEETDALEPMFDSEQKRKQWLSALGPLQADVIGQHVGAGPMLPGGTSPAFAFSIWNGQPMVMAEWFNPHNIVLAAKFCSR